MSGGAGMNGESEKQLSKHINALCTKITSRMIGQPGDHASAAYAEAHFRKLGLRVLDNTMACVGWDLLATSLRVDGKSVPAIGQMYSPSGTARAPLVLVESDLPDRGFRTLKGKAVAVYGNFEPFPDKLMGFARKAERAGAACVIVIDSDAATSATKLIRDRDLKRLPSVSVSLETGFRLAKWEGRQVDLAVKTRRYKSTTRDVIGVLGHGTREICIEAHRDAAPDTPSADDNGSGSAVLLELARLLAGEELRHTIRFVSATAEEFGNVGTPVYARKFASELKLIDLMINADCVGGALCPLRVYVQKDDRILPLVEKTVRPYPSMKVVKTDRRGYGHIMEYLDGRKVSAVDVVNIWANARIHTPKDQPSNLSYAKMADAALFLRDLVVAFDRGAR